MGAPLPSPAASLQVAKTPKELEQDAKYWSEAVENASFKDLMQTKNRLVRPLLGISFSLIIGLCLLAGYAKEFMTTKLAGSFTVGYLLILGGFILCWTVAVLYVKTANREFEVKSQAAIGDLPNRRK